EMKYFISKQTLINNAYNAKSDRIRILFRDGDVADIAKASDSLNIAALSSPVKKYAVAYLRYKA
ncbi:MAG: phosphohydrolase, partial [Flavobacteriales bacterium]